ncbi:MAG: hypothetical protein HQK87_07585 [Nitrospinae bacterium]|nr:hypothetical protein [Nitrospinota bacterium]
MEEPNLPLLTVYYSLAIGGALMALGALFRKPLAKLAARLEADPQKGFKAIFLVSLALYVVIAVVMSIYVAWRILHGAGPFGFPLPQPAVTVSPTPTVAP